ncbi:hypothetical protein F4801DRAFT_568404 [Xylaria longipes]|nr:hypothetical protein F4801DRAFT_568404 [Xylaria longipes]RYC59251.1 hypothetical protein CHU98_g6950 [Xylaria longipes]
MLFKNLAATTFATCTLLVPSAMGEFMTLRWNSKANCKGNSVKYRHYYEDECRTLYDSDHGVEIWETGSPCTLYAYESDDCTGNRAPLASPESYGSVCHSLEGRWSVMVTEC